MRIKLLTLLLCLPFIANSATWYLSASGSDSNPGTISQPFKTLTKLATVYHAGDIVNLNGGNVFSGTITLNGGILQSYGTGNATISGWEQLSGWSSVGTNLWRVHDTNLGTTVRVLTINGAQQAPARLPKTGYYTYNLVSGNTSIHSTTPVDPSYADGQVVIRKNHFEMVTYPISSIASSVITYTGGSGSVPTNGCGFFIQNSLAAVTQQGDWYYDGSGNITMYSTTIPTNVQASRYDNLVTISGNSTVINGVNLVGANQYAVIAQNRSSVIVENCFIQYAGTFGVYFNNCTSSQVLNNTITNTNGNAVFFGTSNTNTISGNTISNIGMIPGIATDYSGVRVVPISARNTTFANNTVAYTGYNGVFIEGGGNMVNHNIIHDCLYWLDDGGCWYTSIGHSPNVVPASIVDHNIAYNAIGAPAGTNDGVNQAVCYYNDDYSNHITMSNNVAYGAGQYCYFLHNNQDITFTNNLGYNAGTSILGMVHDNLGGKLSNINLTGNQFIGTGTQKMIVLKSAYTDSTPSDLQTWGTASGNYYGNTAVNSAPFLTQLYAQSAKNWTFSGWQGITLQDVSGSSYITIPSPNQFNPNPTASPTTISLSDVYKDLPGSSYTGTVSIPAYGALFLYYFSSPPVTTPNIAYSPTSNTYYINTPIASWTPTNTGGTATSWSISPAQPAGIMFNTGTGQLTGNPSALSPSQSYTVTATNSGGSSPFNITIAVIDHAPNISYSPNSQTITLNAPMTPMTPTNVGGDAVSYSVSPALPTGITLNTVTGQISGTPTVLSAPTPYDIVANNTGGNSHTTVTLSVVPPAPAPPIIAYSPSTVIFPINNMITPMVPNSTGGVVASYGISPSLPTGLNFSTSTGIISGLPTVTSPATNYTVIATNVSGSYPTTINISVVNVPPPVPVIIYTPSSNAYIINQSVVNLVPTNTGGDAVTSWSISPTLPSGLSFSTSTGVISGVGTILSPLTSYLVQANNASGFGQTHVSISIVGTPPPINIITVRGFKAQIVGF